MSAFTSKSWLAGALLWLAGAAWSVQSAGLDDRQALSLNDEERRFVLTEMQNYVISIQRIAAALSNNDLPAVATAARSMGMQAMQNAPATLMGKMPAEFRKLGMPTHMAFDQIADAAEDGAGVDVILAKLAGAMQQCVACHAGFRIEHTAP